MIEYIRLKNLGSYDSEGIEITDLKKINFLYGSNGSGKTTLSRFLEDTDSSSDFEDCILNWTNNIDKECLVYNKDFRDKNFGAGTISGVFTLGQATNEQIQEIRKKEEKRSDLQAQIVGLRKGIDKKKLEVQSQNTQFKEDSWIKYYKKNEAFKEVFRGSLSKEAFKEELINNYRNNTATVLPREELTKKYQTIFGKQPNELPLIYLSVSPGLDDLYNRSVWQKKVIGKEDVSIGSLIQRLNMNDWVNQGRKFIGKDETCPFCQEETITEEFRSKLEKFFDDDFSSSLDEIKETKKRIDSNSRNLINYYEGVIEKEKGNLNTKLDTDQFQIHLKTLSSQIIANNQLVAEKEKEPSRSFEMQNVSAELNALDRLIETANKSIKDHNDIVANINVERQSLKRSIWKLIADEASVDIKTHLANEEILKKAFLGLNNSLKNGSEKWKELDNEIKDMSKNVTSIQPTVDEINNTLASFGFLNFTIVPVPGGSNEYQLKRENGTLAHTTLSEGEITFITFLYFLQRAKGGLSSDTVNNERVLVIDDPISSLDSNVLFVVSSLIKEIIESVKDDKGNIKQVLVLTHNVYFHKEVSFINGRENENRNTHYWILRKNGKVSKIQSFERKNPIQTSYELLWRELKEREHNSGIALQNTMRRIIENYFRLLGKYRDDIILSNFSTEEERTICRSLLAWINDGSHSIGDALFIEAQEDQLDKYFKVFEDIFKVTDHHAHYKMMMGIEESEFLEESV